MAGAEGGLIGCHVVDSAGERIGRIAEAIYATPEAATPLYVHIELGLLHSRHVLVPTAAARTDDDGDLVVPYSRDAVRNSPRVSTPLELTAALEAEVAAYYTSTAVS